MNFVIENPKLLYTALAGVIIFILKTYVFKDKFTPELDSWLNVILPSVFFAFAGYFKRITKSQAKVLEMPKVKAEVMTEEIKTQT